MSCRLCFWMGLHKTCNCWNMIGDVLLNDVMMTSSWLLCTTDFYIKKDCSLFGTSYRPCFWMDLDQSCHKWWNMVGGLPYWMTSSWSLRTTDFFRWNSTFFVWYTMHAVFLDGCWPNLTWLMEGWTCWWCTLFNDIIKLVMGHWFPLKDVLFCMPFVFQATFPVISLPNLVKVITTSQGWVLFNDIIKMSSCLSRPTGFD